MNEQETLSPEEIVLYRYLDGEYTNRQRPKVVQGLDEETAQKYLRCIALFLKLDSVKPSTKGDHEFVVDQIISGEGIDLSTKKKFKKGRRNQDGDMAKSKIL